MHVLARIRSWFRGPSVDSATQRDADALREQRDMIRIWHGDSPVKGPPGSMPMPPRRDEFAEHASDG
jgi:hypothetical protein